MCPCSSSTGPLHPPSAFRASLARARRRAAAQRAPSTWQLIVHPERAVATRYAATYPGDPGDVVVATSGSAALQAARAAAPRGHGRVIVWIAGIDRFADGWPGHRIAQRLAMAGDVEVVAWTAAADVDGQALAQRLGMRTLVPGGAGAACAAADPAAADEQLARWVARRYPGGFWAPWTEHGLAAIAGGGSTKEQEQRLELALPADEATAAARRLRRLSEMLAGEVRDDGVLLRSEALAVLARLATLRPIVAEPYAARSLALTVHRLAAHPTLAGDAGLSAQQVDVLRTLAAKAEVLRAREACTGRPRAGAWRRHRDQAVLEAANESGLLGHARAAYRDELAAFVEDAMDAVHDVLSDGMLARPSVARAWDDAG